MYLGSPLQTKLMEEVTSMMRVETVYLGNPLQTNPMEEVTCMIRVVRRLYTWVARCRQTQWRR